MSRLFALVARPLATPDTPGAFLNGLRLMAVDAQLLMCLILKRTPGFWDILALVQAPKQLSQSPTRVVG
jgi:hypothetical protein